MTALLLVLVGLLALLLAVRLALAAVVLLMADDGRWGGSA